MVVVLGVATALLGLLAAAATVDALLENPDPAASGLVLLGRAVFDLTPRARGIAVASGAALSVLLIAVGLRVLTAGRHLARTRAMREASTRNAGLEARNRLLDGRAKRLTHEVQDLERRRAEASEEVDRLRGEIEARRSVPISGPGRVIVIPEPVHESPRDQR